jgi:hypothetical protein
MPEKTDMPRVSIIILNWNRFTDTAECIESVLKIDYPNYEIVVVDNGSSDDSVQKIHDRFEHILLIENNNNLGYAEGNNVGIRHALKNGAEYVWVLNNDTVVDPHALTAMMDLAEKNQEIGILGSKIYYFDQPKTLWFAGATIDWKRAFSPHIGRLEIDTGQYEIDKEVDRVTGCSMLIRKRVLEDVGLFDENYFLYAEEVDLCVRARNKGYRNYYVPKSVVYHKISISTGEDSAPVYGYYNTRNFLYLIKKNAPFPKREYYLFRTVWRILLGGKGTIFRMTFPSLFQKDAVTLVDKAPLIGLHHFLTGRMGKGYFSQTL